MLKNEQDISKALHIASQITMKKKQCAAMAIMNNEGKVLFLKRSPQDSFHPSTWCLPGGGIEGYEDAVSAVKREVYEESGIEDDTYTILEVMKVALPDVDIFYYKATLNNPNEVQSFIRIDDEEHVQYQWCMKDEWDEMDLILDLKNHMNVLFKNEMMKVWQYK